MKPKDEQRLAALAVQARQAALSVGVGLLCIGPVLTIAAGAVAGASALVTGAGLLRFAGSDWSGMRQK